MTVKPGPFVVSVFGGVRAAARALGRSSTSVSKWRMSKAKGGTDGRVPSKMMARVLAVAKRRGLDVTPADLVIGRVTAQ